MRVLVTSSRFPHALAEIRKLGQCGHEVYATDTFRTSPGNHSRYVREAILTKAAPALEPRRYLDELEQIVRTRRIELLLPQCEEVLYITQQRARFAALTRLFCPPFATLARLHNKKTFVELARSLGLRVPRTEFAHSHAELRAALDRFSYFVARPAYSRAGTRLFSNAGAFAGRMTCAQCDPTPERPWLVQEFVEGTDVCSFSVARGGRLVAHSTYVHPKTIDHVGGISFVSVDEPEALACARRVAAALDYEGQLSFDFMKNEQGLWLMECNPRPTAGVLMMPACDFADAVCDPVPGPLRVAPAGVREQIGVALVRDMLREPREFRSDLAALFSGVEDAYWQKGDALPGIYQFLSYTLLMTYRRRHGIRGRARSHQDLVEAQFHDIAWNGEAVA
jgi:predicted ATP-grasp superfamily ATP-dependent carboligase